MWSSKCKIAISAAAFIGMVVCSIYTSTSSMRNLIKIKYDIFTNISDMSSLKKMTSTSQAWRQPQSKAKTPFSQAVRANPAMAPTSLTMKDDDKFMDIQADVQLRRRRQLKDGCFKNNVYNDSRVSVVSNMIVDEKHKLVYCYVPKVACTSWKRVFLVLKGIMNHTDDLKQSVVNNKIGPRTLSFLKSYNNSQRAKILESYTKFLVVRHPFQRVLSAYQNKLWAGSTSPSSGSFQRKIGLHILKEYRPNTIMNNKSGSVERKTVLTKDKRKVNYDLRFDEFVKFLTNKSEPESFLKNNHWREIDPICRPCQIDYDIISHFETLVDDALYILRLVHADHVVEFPSSKGSSPTNSSSKSIYDSYFANIPGSDLEKLYQKYRLDFELFGYGKPEILL